MKRQKVVFFCVFSLLMVSAKIIDTGLNGFLKFDSGSPPVLVVVSQPTGTERAARRGQGFGGVVRRGYRPVNWRWRNVRRSNDVRSANDSSLNFDG